MNKQLIIKIGGIVSAIIFALGAVFPLASAEIFGTTVSASLLDGGDWVYVIINAALVIAGMLLSEHTALILCAISSGLLAFLELKRFFDGSSDQFSAFLTKGAGFYCLLIGAILIIVFTIVVQFVKDSLTNKSNISSNRKCPFCAEKIKTDAKMCRYCGSKLDEISEVTPSDNDNGSNADTNHRSRLVAKVIMLIASVALLAVIVIFSIGGFLKELDNKNENNSVSDDVKDTSFHAILEDYDDCLDNAEEEELLVTMQSTAEKIECNVGVVISADLNGKDSRNYADDFADDSFGYGSDNVVLLLCNDQIHVDWISTYGRGTDLYGSNTDRIFDELYAGFDSSGYYAAVVDFCNALQDIGAN